MKNAICIEHGDTTCAIAPGNFCMFVGTKSFGTRYVCLLFGDEPLYDANGWLQRCDQCKTLLTGDRLLMKEDLR